jgi:hypothetical protein
MRTCETNEVENFPARHPLPAVKQSPFEANHLHLVTTHDLQSLRDALARGQVPTDLEAKLISLSKGDLVLRSIEKNCRTIIALLQASQEGSFRKASHEESERLLRVLSYVRKDDDAICDYRPDGFTDDQQEMRAATTKLSPLLQEFKAWRLRHQVPRMWQRTAML